MGRGEPSGALPSLGLSVPGKYEARSGFRFLRLATSGSIAARSTTLLTGTETACDAAIPMLNESTSPGVDGSVHRSGASTDTIAVVIPYFKLRYLGEALESLASQSDSNFSVFIGDDCSPDD